MQGRPGKAGKVFESWLGEVKICMTRLLVWLTNTIALRDEEGQTAVEYAMVVALVAIVIAGFLAAGATNFFSSFWTKVTGAL
jgi:Flp pilus assembly pilin Flp